MTTPPPPRIYDDRGFRRVEPGDKVFGMTELAWTDATGRQRFVQMAGVGPETEAALREAVEGRDG